MPYVINRINQHHQVFVVLIMPRTFQEQKEWERIFRRQWLQSLSHMTIQEAANFSGTNRTLIKQQAEAHNVFFKPGKSRTFPAIEVAFIRKSLLAGKSFHYIARTLNKHPNSIRYQAQKMKIGSRYQMTAATKKLAEKHNAS